MKMKNQVGICLQQGIRKLVDYNMGLALLC